MAGKDADDVKPVRKLGRGLEEVSHIFLSGAEKPKEEEEQHRHGAKLDRYRPAGEKRLAPDHLSADSPCEEPPPDDAHLWLPSATYISITSGETARGKTLLTANLAFSLFLRGRKVAVVNADPDKPDVLDVTGSAGHGPTSGLMIANQAYGGIAAADALSRVGSTSRDTSYGSDVPGPVERPGAPLRDPSGTPSTAPLGAIEAAAREAQVVLIDTSPWADLSRSIWTISTLCIVVAEPGAEKMRASYVAIKRIHSVSPNARIGLVLNLVRSYAHGEECFRKLADVCRKFLKINVRNYGYILYDAAVNEAFQQAVPLLTAFPDSKAGRCIDSILGLIVMDESAIARRRREVTFEGCALKKGKLQALRSS